MGYNAIHIHDVHIRFCYIPSNYTLGVGDNAIHIYDVHVRFCYSPSNYILGVGDNTIHLHDVFLQSNWLRLICVFKIK